MRRKIQLGQGETERVACVSASAFRGLDTVTGEVWGTEVLAERVGWLTSLVETLCTQVTSAHWNRADLARLASGRDCSGARLPSNAWMAVRTLGWGAVVPAGMYVPDRVRRVAEEQAGRALRSAWWRSEITDAVLATWPAGPDADRVRDRGGRRPGPGHLEVLPPLPERVPPPRPPDRLKPGWKWATCPNPACGYSADRDVAAWQRIGARGLTHQHTTVLDRSSGTYVIRRTVKELDQPVRHTSHPGTAR